MDREKLEVDVESAVDEAYDSLRDKINATEGEGAVRLSQMIAVMYRDSIEQSVKIVMKLLANEGVIKFD